MVPAKRYGRCATQAICRRQASGSTVARSRPPARTRPAAGAAKPRRTFSKVDLPAPEGPTSATVSPGLTSNDVSASEGWERPGWRTTSPSTDSAVLSGTGSSPVVRGGVSSTAKISSAAARPSAAAWYCAPTCRNGRYASGARISTSRPVYRSRSPCTSRIPMPTATSATESVASSSSAKEDRKAIRRVRSVARRYSPVMARMDAACALARPKTFSVGSPATTSRKWPDSRDSSRHWRSMRFCVAQPMRIMNSGISGSVTTMIAAEIQSPATIRASTATGTTTARPSCGR